MSKGEFSLLPVSGEVTAIDPFQPAATEFCVSSCVSSFDGTAVRWKFSFAIASFNGNIRV
jgi:hypothetical protein